MKPTRHDASRVRYVREEDFKAPKGHKVSLRSPLVAVRQNNHNRSYQVRQVNLNPCRSCSQLFDKVRHLEVENHRLRQHQQKSKEDSQKLQRLCLEIARTKEKMVAKILQKQEDLMDVLSTSRGMMSSRNDSFNETTMPTRLTSRHNLKLQSIGI